MVLEANALNSGGFVHGARIRKYARSLLLIFTTVSASILLIGVSPAVASTATPPRYVVIILMENQNYGSVYNCGTDCAYLTSLANTYGLATNYHAIQNPSLPNYMALTAGQSFSSWSSTDCEPDTMSCTAGSAANIVDRLESAGKTWKAYAEDYPVSSGCYLGSPQGEYVGRHFPFNYFSDIYSNPARCTRLVAANTVPWNGTTETDDVLLTDLQSATTASNYMWLTPNLCDDMHDCSVSSGSTYLQGMVPKILSSNVFQTQNAAVFLVWDEGYTNTYQVAAIWAGSTVKQSYKSSVSYSHYSFLATLESIWGMPSLTSNDATATPMTEFFGSSTTSNSWNPAVTCQATLVTISQVIGAQQSFPGGGATYDGGGYIPGIPDKRSTSPPCNVNGNPTFVEIDGLLVGTTNNDTDCIQPANFPCDTYWNAEDQNSASCPLFTNDNLMCKIHVEIDQAWKAAGISPPDPIANTLIDIQGFVYWDPIHVNETGHNYSGWEIHPVTAWKIHNNDFTLSAKPNGLVIKAGSSATSTITVTSQNFAGNVSLDSSTSSGLAVSLNPSSVVLANNTSVDSTLTILTGSVEPGSYNITVTGTAEITGATVTKSIRLTVKVVDFALTLNPSFIATNSTVGSSASSTFKLTSLGGFNGTVNLSVLVSPSTGLLAKLSQSRVFLTTSKSLSLVINTTLSSSATRFYNVTVKGSSGILSHTATVDVEVLPQPDFVLSSSSNGITLFPGSSGSSNMTLTSLNGYSGIVGLNTAAPPGLSAKLDSSNMTIVPESSNTTVLTISVGLTTFAGSYIVNVTGTSGSFLHTATITVNVSPLPDFSMSTSTASFTVAVGQASTATLIMKSLNGYSDPSISLSYSITPRDPGDPIITFDPSSISLVAGESQTSTLNISTAGSTPTGIYTIILVGSGSSSSGRTHTATVTLSVVDFSIDASATALTIENHSSTALTIALASLGGFAGKVTISTSVSPSPGLSVSPSTFSAKLGTFVTQTLTLSTTLANSYLLNVTATSGTLAHTVLITVNGTDYSISVSPTTLTIDAGAPASSMITLKSLGGFSGVVSLKTSKDLGGPSNSLDPTSMTLAPGTNGTIVLSVSGSNTGPGLYNVTITGSSGDLTRSTIVKIRIVDFGITATPPSRSIPTGSSATFTVTLASFGLNGNVTLATSIEPAGPAPTFNSATVKLTPGATKNALLTVNTGSAALGSYDISAIGTSGSISHSVLLSIDIWNVTLSSSAVSPNGVVAGDSMSLVITLNSTDFSGNLNLTATIAPLGPTLSMNPTIVNFTLNSSITSTLTISTTNMTAIGTYTVTVAARAGAFSRIISFTFAVISDFTISASPSRMNIQAGSSGSSTITVGSLGIAGIISLSASISPTATGFSSQFTIPSLSVTPGSTKSSVLMFSTKASTSSGWYNLTATAIHGSTVHATTITLFVGDPPGFELTATPSMLSVLAGTSRNSTLVITDLHGLSGSVSLTGLPSSVNLGISFLPSSVTLSPGGSDTAVLTIFAKPGAIGSYTLKVSGTDGSLANSTTLTVNVVDFAIASNAKLMTALLGSANSTEIDLTSVNGFSGTVCLSATIVPNGPSVSFSPLCTLVAGGGTNASSVTISELLSTGTFSLTVIATSGGVSHQVAVTLEVVDFNLSASSKTLVLHESSTAQAIVSVFSSTGFSGDVTLTSSVSPVGPSLSLSQTGIFLVVGRASSNSLLIVSVDSTTPPGSYTVNITGTVGLATRSYMISVVVLPIPILRVPIYITASPGSKIVFSVNATDFDATKTLVLTASSLPSGATFPPVIGTGAVRGLLSWTLSKTQGPGNYTVAFLADDSSGGLGRASVTIHVNNLVVSPTSTLSGSRILYIVDGFVGLFIVIGASVILRRLKSKRETSR